jgi:hypothetical protein
LLELFLSNTVNLNPSLFIAYFILVVPSTLPLEPGPPLYSSKISDEDVELVKRR